MALYAAAGLSVLVAAVGGFALIGMGGLTPIQQTQPGPVEARPAVTVIPAAPAPRPAAQAVTEPSLATAAPIPAEPELREQRLALREAGPGLALVVGPGDTMPAMYAKVYRGVRAPEYAQVVAMNQGSFRPGAIVLFPTPPGGWGK